VLGRQNGAIISRYEKRRRLPPLEIALALEALLGIPVSQLFAGVFEVTNDDVAKRMRALRSQLQARTFKGSEALVAAHKLRWLAAREDAEVRRNSSL